MKKIRVDKTADLLKGLVISSFFFTKVDNTSVSIKFPPFSEVENYLVFYNVLTHVYVTTTSPTARSRIFHTKKKA